MVEYRIPGEKVFFFMAPTMASFTGPCPLSISREQGLFVQRPIFHFEQWFYNIRWQASMDLRLVREMEYKPRDDATLGTAQCTSENHEGEHQIEPSDHPKTTIYTEISGRRSLCTMTPSLKFAG